MELKKAMSEPRCVWSHSQMTVFFGYVLLCWVLATPGTAYSLENCTIVNTENVTLDCRNRKLGAIPADIPQRTTSLDISTNLIWKIEKGDLKNKSMLIKLRMDSNQISHVDDETFSDLKALQMLDLSNNKLTSISDLMFLGLNTLSKLLINDNLITTITLQSFQNFHNLKYVDLTNNHLGQLSSMKPILQLPQLNNLFIGENKFTYFLSSEISNKSIALRNLDISDNPMTFFNITDNVFPDLQYLGLARCGTKDMEWNVPDRSFLSNVTSLSLTDVRLSLEMMSTMLQSFTTSLAKIVIYNLLDEHAWPLINIACQIPTLETLQLQNISTVSEKLLQSCTHLIDLNLEYSNLTELHEFSFRPMKQIRRLILRSNQFSAVPNATRNLTTLQILDLRNNSIQSLCCLDFAKLTRLKELYLNNNQITDIKHCFFQDLRALEYLDLDSNTIQDVGDTFKEGFQKLKLLNLNKNQLTSIQPDSFKGLKSLKVLYLSYNQILYMQPGAFQGLTRLTDLHVGNNWLVSEYPLTYSVFKGLKSLQTLDISQNNIYYSTDKEVPSIFSTLTSLKYLYFDTQGPEGEHIHHIPTHFLKGLRSLVMFSAERLFLNSLSKDTFLYTPHLEVLNISNNDFRSLSPELFQAIPMLKELHVQHARLLSLDFLILANLTQLTYLNVKLNEFTEINETVIHSVPALNYLDMQDNLLSCDCMNAWFIQWLKNDTSTQVVYAHDLVCRFKEYKKPTKLMDFDIHTCSEDFGFFYFISTTSVVLLTLLGSLTYYFLRWQVVYAYYLFLAYLHDTKHRKRPAPNQYDAFVSYNSQDEPWVLEELLPELEENQGWRLCLHHRDFQPGKPIVENITDAIYGSRKTICVITRRYLESEWCSREIQVASFRLFDEQKDVLILVFLEEIPDQQLSLYHRMRKMLKKRTYLSWPRAGEHTETFWLKLRMALETRDNDDEENLLIGPRQR
ncbi:hypothetical protein UPYG_G00191740 [Umbra pygmaea]|uniref:TIR domain-containing protein n=1 Tax=Umbra pygmaea TaxID=75934 RepID=A0ABD0XBI8_UMBPY